MKPVTLAIHENERAWSIRERNLVRPPAFQWRRWQIITVIRNDQLTEWWDDLGPSANFKGLGFEMPSLGEYSVAELRDHATRLRNDTTWVGFAAEKQAESTLIKDFLDQVEEHWKVINNQSTYGPGGHKQRDGFPKKAVIDAYGT